MEKSNWPRIKCSIAVAVVTTESNSPSSKSEMYKVCFSNWRAFLFQLLNIVFTLLTHTYIILVTLGKLSLKMTAKIETKWLKLLDIYIHFAVTKITLKAYGLEICKPFNSV